MKTIFLSTSLLALTSWGLWFTPAQQGDRLSARKDYAGAAGVYQDPMRIGTAWFRAGEFEKAAQAFSRFDTAESAYNQAACLIFLGKYEDAVTRLDRALELRPGWEDAEVNRAIAQARAEALKQEGGDMGDQKIGADKIVFDKNSKKGGQDTKVEGSKASSDQTTQALWLQRMQTNPADFLKSKFSYQLTYQKSEEASP